MTYLEKTTTRESLQDAFTTIEQSVQVRIKKLLIVTDDSRRARKVEETLQGVDLDVLRVATGGEALAVVGQQYIDGVVIDLRLSDIPALDLAEEIHATSAAEPPAVILYGKRDLSDAEMPRVYLLKRSGNVEHARTPEDLLDRTVLLLHRAEAQLSDEQREILATIRRFDETLSGKKILVVDDDLRNIFALTSVLEQHGLQVVHAENGRDGIEILRSTSNIDAVLMDIMMPEMDGYETTRAIRQLAAFHSLPIIALTAKAMKGDREKCLQAGASDYVTKPVDLEQLFFGVARLDFARA